MKKTSNRSGTRFLERIFLKRQTVSKKKRSPRRLILRPAGKVYHLEEIRDAINKQYFETPLLLPITWFGSGNIPKSSVLFGSYTYETQLVKVNRVLDREDVPIEFVRYIVFHEMLHHLHPPKRGRRGRRDIHHSEFRERERQFLEFDQAKAFLKEWRKTHFTR